MKQTDHLRAGRVAVFLDYMNVYKGAREAFFGGWDAHWFGQIRPMRLGLKLAGAGDDRRTLASVQVYRGQPSQTRDPKAARAFGRQTYVWSQESLTRTVSRPLNYRTNPPREKGIDVKLAVDLVAAAIRREFDVAVVFSGDTDLLPALELVADLLGHPAVEVAAWRTTVGESRPLRINDQHPWCHFLDRTDYDHVADHTDYTTRARRR